MLNIYIKTDNNFQHSLTFDWQSRGSSMTCTSILVLVIQLTIQRAETNTQFVAAHLLDIISLPYAGKLLIFLFQT